MSKERYTNPAIGDEVILRLFAYNANNLVNFDSVVKVDIYYLDPYETSAENTDGRRLVETITEVTQDEVGKYYITTTLESPKYVIGNYLDVWTVEINGEDGVIENVWQVYPSLFYTTPIPIVYDFNFTFRPNRLRLGEKKYLIIDIEPNVPNSTDLQRYYENIAISSPLKISIEQSCGDCVPAEKDLRLIVDEDSVEVREKCVGYYYLDTSEMEPGIYNVSFKMEFGENVYISEKSQLQIVDV